MHDTSSLKVFLYDWFGYNVKISEAIHSWVVSKYAIKLFDLITQIGNTNSFPITFGLLLIVLFMLLREDKKNATQKGVSYARCLVLLLVSITLSILLVSVMKTFFHYTRPHCFSDFDMSKDMLNMFSYPKESCNKSFPSGHTVYISVLVLSLWGILTRELKIAGILLIILIGISRVILGWHFMADVVYGFMLVLFIINPIGNWLVTRYFPIAEPLVKKLLKKIV